MRDVFAAGGRNAFMAWAAAAPEARGLFRPEDESAAAE